MVLLFGDDTGFPAGRINQYPFMTAAYDRFHPRKPFLRKAFPSLDYRQDFTKIEDIEADTPGLSPGIRICPFPGRENSCKITLFAP